MLEVALENAKTARQVVFELFQDLEGFRLDDYRRFDDGGKGMDRLLRYVQEGVHAANGRVSRRGSTLFDVALNGTQVTFTTDRETAKEDEHLTLLGIEHPLVRRLTHDHRNLPAAHRALVARDRGEPALQGTLSIWHVQVHGGKGQYHQKIIPIGLNEGGERTPAIERLVARLRDLDASHENLLRPERRVEWVRSLLPEMIRRELAHTGSLPDGASFSTRLVAWVELV